MNIKKIIAGLSAFATAFTLCTAIDGNTLSAADVTYYIVGDANEDDKLNVSDAACIARALAKNKTKTLPESADYTQDGIINVSDAAGIARYCAKSYNSDKPLTTVPVTQPAVTTATETTTTTVATQTTEEAETNSATSTNQNIIETEVTTEVSINELPIETVTTTTTVTTTSEPVETTTVTTTTQVAETTVSDNNPTSINDYYIVYKIKPIYEMHNISHGENIDRTIMYYEWATTTDSEDKCGDYWDRNIFHPWHIEQFGYFCQGFYTQQRIIGFSYEFYCANPWDNALKAKPDSSLAIYSAEEFSKIVGRDIPEYFESTKCIDGNGVIHDMYDEFFRAGGDNPPTPDKTNVLDYYDVFISSPVIYYNNIDRSTGELKS